MVVDIIKDDRTGATILKPLDQYDAYDLCRWLNENYTMVAYLICYNGYDNAVEFS